MSHARIPVNMEEQRKIALMFIATGSIFTGIASILGMLLIISSSLKINFISTELFSVHPLLQIFGFLTEFVLGVAYSLIPSFKSHGLPSYPLAYLSYGMITVANGGYIFSMWVSMPSGLSEELLSIFLLLELAAAAIFLWQIGYVIRKGRKTKLEGDAYLFISPLSLLLSLSAVIYSILRGLDPFSMGVVYLALVGFAGSMIFGVSLKTVAVRFTTNMAGTYRYGVYAQSAAVVSAFLSVYFQSFIASVVTSVLFMTSASLFVLTAKTFSQSRLLVPDRDRLLAHRGSTRGHGNLLFLEASFMVASAWLISGVFFGLLYSFSLDYWVRIAFIHSFSIGFIGSTIIGIAPVLLPGILSRNVPSGKNSLMPLYLLNAGLVIFIAGDLVALNNAFLPFWAGTGGPIIIISMLFFMYEIHRSLISRKRENSERVSFSDDW